MWNSSMFNITEIEEAFKAKFEKRVGNFSKLPKRLLKLNNSFTFYQITTPSFGNEFGLTFMILALRLIISLKLEV